MDVTEDHMASTVLQLALLVVLDMTVRQNVASTVQCQIDVTG